MWLVALPGSAATSLELRPQTNALDQRVPYDHIVEAMRSAGFAHARMCVPLPGAFCEFKEPRPAGRDRVDPAG